MDIDEYEKTLMELLGRIANALEEQNRIYVERCEQADKLALEAEDLRFAHDFDIVREQQKIRTEQLELEHRNLRLLQEVYAMPGFLEHQAALMKEHEEQHDRNR